MKTFIFFAYVFGAVWASHKAGEDSEIAGVLSYLFFAVLGSVLFR